MPDPSTDLADPAPERPAEELLSKRVVGYAFLGCVGLLVLVLLYMIVGIIGPLTRTPVFTEKLIDSVIEDIDSADPQRQRFSLEFVTGLEYGAAQIRTINVQIAIASIGGFFLIVIGVILFAIGFVTPFGFQGTVGKLSLNWVNGAPGIFCALLGAILMIVGVTRPTLSLKQVEFSQETRPGADPNSDAPSGQNTSFSSGFSGVPEGIDADYAKPKPTENDGESKPSVPEV
ncbi:hypothetical protein [Bremerella volcania]|uniref:hypothetical protein n=1 Tax=Bremerella volcania TaxID=2527984 RepID=UPI0011A40FA8|nr:hypothetical protein [Bremerella volcania]